MIDRCPRCGSATPFFRYEDPHCADRVPAILCAHPWHDRPTDDDIDVCESCGGSGIGPTGDTASTCFDCDGNGIVIHSNNDLPCGPCDCEDCKPSDLNPINK